MKPWTLGLLERTSLEAIRSLWWPLYQVERCQAVAGLSLGEYTALTVAGVFDFETGLKVVKLRGEAMQVGSAGKTDNERNPSFWDGTFWHSFFLFDMPTFFTFLTFLWQIRRQQKHLNKQCCQLLDWRRTFFLQGQPSKKSISHQMPLVAMSQRDAPLYAGMRSLRRIVKPLSLVCGWYWPLTVGSTTETNFLLSWHVWPLDIARAFTWFCISRGHCEEPLTKLCAEACEEPADVCEALCTLQLA